MLASVLLVNCYSSSLYSILTVAVHEPTIDSLDDLERAARQDTHHILTWADSSYLSQFIYAEPENQFYYTVGQHINR